MALQPGEVRISRVRQMPPPSQSVPPTPSIYQTAPEPPKPEPQIVRSGVIQLDKFQNQQRTIKPPGVVIRQFGYLPEEWLLERVGELLALADTHVMQFCTALQGALKRKVRITDESGQLAFAALVGSDTSIGSERLVANFTAPPNDVGHNALASQLVAHPPAVGADFLAPLTVDTDRLMIPQSVQRGSGVATSPAQRVATAVFPDQSNIRVTMDPFQSLQSQQQQQQQQAATGPTPLESFNPFMSLANQQLPVPSVPITAGDIAQDALNRASDRPESPRRAQMIVDNAIIATGDAGGVLDAMARANQAHAPVALLPNGHAHIGGPLTATATQAAVIDPRENIQVALPHGGTQTIYGPRDGSLLGVRMLARGGTTKADLQLFNTVYPRPHAHVTHHAQQQSQRTSSRYNILQAALAGLPRGLRNREELVWRMLPEHLGLLFLTDEVTSGIVAATSDVNTRNEAFSGTPPSLARQVITSYDLMTHEATMAHFVKLVMLHIQKYTKLNDVTGRDNVEMQLYLDNQISLVLYRLSKVRFSLDQSVATYSNYNPEVYALRFNRMAFPPQSDMPSFSALYAARDYGALPQFYGNSTDAGIYRHVMQTQQQPSTRPTADQMDEIKYARSILSSYYGE